MAKGEIPFEFDGPDATLRVEFNEEGYPVMTLKFHD